MSATRELLRPAATGDVAAGIGDLLVLGARPAGSFWRLVSCADHPGNASATQLLAVWPSGTLRTHTLEITWRVGAYNFAYRPAVYDDERHTDPPGTRFVYDPEREDPLWQGGAEEAWDGWGISYPSDGVRTAEVAISGSPHIVMLGAAITRNGIVMCTDGPKPGIARCSFDFT